jgi:hypothetical protein
MSTMGLRFGIVSHWSVLLDLLRRGDNERSFEDLDGATAADFGGFA